MAAERSDGVAAERSDVDNYDVFINFRGADVRTGFAYRLYHDLVAAGLRVFLDDEELNKGRPLDVELPQAIDNSKIYITIISEKYASSKWCLRELAQMVRNKQQFKENEILPVLYKITPEDVKLKTKLFEDQLNSLKEKVPAETVKAWTEALTGIPALKLWTVPHGCSYDEEGQYCREIVKRVSTIRKVRYMPLPKDLIGMDDPVEEVMQLLDIENSGFQVIGIHGIGGSGKTTLANAVYNKLCDDGKFDRCCFLPDVRESLGKKDKRRKNRLELQKKVLQQLSFKGDIDGIRDDVDAAGKIQLALKGKKVLMVFDDVSHVDQILKLISNDDSIGELNGSQNRIIITTRKKEVLTNTEFWRFTTIRTMEKMKDEHALELFSWYAFGKPMPPAEYVERSKNVVSLTGKFPLYLKTIGRTFGPGRRENWEEKVEKLKNVLDEDVYECLMISYEDLKAQTREVFLDIACFFVDKFVSYETLMWRTCEFYPKSAIEELTFKCFVEKDRHGIYRMHDSIKDLGREIVRREGPEDKEQRSRIWKKKDAIEILTSRKNKESNIKGILVEIWEDEILTLKAENFVHLNKLRFLHLNGAETPDILAPRVPCLNLEGSFKDLLPKLIWLSLSWITMEQFNGTNFSLEKLVVLNFSLSDITHSWAGWKEFKDLPRLEVLDLSYCQGLKKTPDLSHCTSLKKLLLFDCRNLEEIDRSIIYLKTLEYLDLSGCWSLKELPANEPLEDSTRPNSIGVGLVNLEHLSLSGCSSLENLPNSITSLPKLRHLDLSFYHNLKRLPDSIGELVELEVLLLRGCEGLVSLPNSLTSLPKLRILNVSFCYSLKSLPDSVGEMVLQLTELDISGSALKKLPGFISKQKKLEVLRVDRTREMQEVGPTEIEELTCLREMSFHKSSICGLPSLVKLTRLEKLNLHMCNHLQQLPAELPASLVQLHVSSKSLQSVPNYSNLIHLTDLRISSLNKSSGDLGRQQELNLRWIWKLSKLKMCVINTDLTTTIQSEEPSACLSQLVVLTLWCPVLETCVVIPSFLHALRTLDIKLYRGAMSLTLPRLNSLTSFILKSSQDLKQILGLGELESLLSLKIERCDSLETLDDISKLTLLQTLKITECKRLRVISVVPFLQSLKELKIYDCALLESLVGPSEGSESYLDDLLLVKDLLILECPLLPNDLHRRLLMRWGMVEAEEQVQTKQRRRIKVQRYKDVDRSGLVEFTSANQVYTALNTATESQPPLSSLLGPAPTAPVGSDRRKKKQQQPRRRRGKGSQNNWNNKRNPNPNPNPKVMMGGGDRFNGDGSAPFGFGTGSVHFPNLLNNSFVGPTPTWSQIRDFPASQVNFAQEQSTNLHDMDWHIEQITEGLANLSISEQPSTDQLFTGSSSGLPVTSSGSPTLSTPTHTFQFKSMEKEVQTIQRRMMSKDMDPVGGDE